MRFYTEALPGIVVALIVMGLTVMLIRAHRRALKAEERAEDAESAMGKIMKYRGITRSDLDELGAGANWGAQSDP